jgi:hypothetical protein
VRRAALLWLVASGCAAAPPTVRSDVIDLYPGAFVELALLEREVLDACSLARDCTRPEPESRLDLSLSVHDGRATGVEVAPTSTDEDGFRRCAIEVVSRHRFPAEAPDRVPLTIVSRWPELGVDPADADGARVACTIAAHHRVLARCSGDRETRGDVVVSIEHVGEGRALLHGTTDVTRGLQATAERYAACVTEALSGMTLPASLGAGPWTVRLPIGP